MFNLFIIFPPMKLQRIKSGFTLIELLVVITIIGILATWAVSIYTSQIQKARDSTRLTDVKALQWGIEQFYQDWSEYPLGLDDWIWSWTTVQIYMPTLAQDPKHDQTCFGSRCGYVYRVANDSNWITNGNYEISTALENSWNVTSKATNTADNWNDANRIELWVWQNTIDTSSAQGTAFSTNVAVAATNPIVIKKSAVYQK